MWFAVGKGTFHVRNMLPRLKNLLTILAGDERPVPVTEMAERLRVSRRTVFRELEHIDTYLEPYGLGLGSIPGEGLLLEGGEQAVSRLREDLGQMEGGEPAHRRDRHRRLILLLFQHPGQKLFFYADRFKVSASTISHDLDEVEPWLALHAVRLSRSIATGIVLEADEYDRRRMIMAVNGTLRKEGSEGEYPVPDIVLDIAGLAGEIAPVLTWMTPQSQDAVLTYLAVVVQRVMEGITLGDLRGSDPGPGFEGIAAALADLLEQQFDIVVNGAERRAIALELAAGRLNTNARPEDADDEHRLRALAYQMLEHFDAEVAPLLKLDETLLGGLVAHFRPMLVRLEHRIELPDPLLGQMSGSYPDVMEKCRLASEVLPGAGVWLPESEVSFLAAHFGAAMLRLSDRGVHRRTVRIGVVCVHGIGTSYLLASQVKRLFGSEAEAEVGWWGDREGWKRFDFLIGTTPLSDAGKPVVVVPPMLDEAATKSIGEQIAMSASRAAAAVAGPAAGDFSASCLALEELAADARTLLENFGVQSAPGDIAFDDLAKMAGYRFGDTEESGRLIYEKLMERESISTQVIRELELVLLHCGTDGVARPRLGLIVPRGGTFTGRELGAAKSCIVMLIPPHSPRERLEMMGGISSAFLQNEAFLAAVLAGEGGEVRGHVENILRNHLLQYATHAMKG